jgi:hypothetical protein
VLLCCEEVDWGWDVELVGEEVLALCPKDEARNKCSCKV